MGSLPVGASPSRFQLRVSWMALLLGRFHSCFAPSVAAVVAGTYDSASCEPGETKSD